MSAGWSCVDDQGEFWVDYDAAAVHLFPRQRILTPESTDFFRSGFPASLCIHPEQHDVPQHVWETLTVLYVNEKHNNNQHSGKQQMVQNMKTISSYPLHHFLFMVNSGAQAVPSNLLLTARRSGRVPSTTPLVSWCCYTPGRLSEVYQLQPLAFPLQPLHRPVPKPPPVASQATCRADVQM